MEKIFEKLIAFKTVSGDFAVANAALDYIEAYLVERGMFVSRGAYRKYPWLAATTRPNRKNPTVMLGAHIDVVPAPDDMFALRKVNGKYYGRGVYDMKFCIANYMQIVDDLKDDLADYDFGILINSDEEVGGEGNFACMEELLKDGWAPRVTILPDGGDNWQLETSAKGAWMFNLIAKGQAWHGSRPWEVDIAAYRLVDALTELKTMFADQGPTTNTMSITKLRGGEATNQIAGLVSAGLDIRVLNDKDRAQIRLDVEQLAEKHQLEIETVNQIGYCENDPNDPFLRDLMSSVEVITGRSAETRKSYGATDGRFFTAQGLPVAIIRPNGGAQHANEEWLDVQGFFDFKDMLRDYLERVLNKRISAAYEPEPTERIVETVTGRL